MKNTFTKPADFWQERDFSAKISATFEFIGAHWRPLGHVLLYLVAPFALVQGIVAGALQLHAADAFRSSVGEGGIASFRFANYLSAFNSPLYLLSSILGGLFQSVLILSVYGYLMRCVYAEQPGQAITVPQVWEVVKSKLLSTYFSLIGIWLIIAFGFVLFFVPGFYMLVTLSLFFVVGLFENSDFTATISRCVDLIRGKWWSTLGLLCVMGIIIYLALASVGVVFVLVGWLKSLLSPSATLPSSLLVLYGAIRGLFLLVLYVPIMLVLAFQYFNLVERKEGVGLRLLVDKLGDSQAAAPAESSHYQPEEEGEY